MKLSKLLLTFAVAATSCSAAFSADGVQLVYKTTGKEALTRMSDNAQWGVMSVPLTEAPEFNVNGKVVNLADGTVKSLSKNGLNSCSANDVSNDGTVVVGAIGTGSIMEQQAVYKDGEWHYLPYPEGSKWPGGKAFAVTPDGRYAVGMVYDYDGGGENYGEAGVLWDLNTLTVVPTTNMPTVNLHGEKIRQIRFTDISSDGTKILGHVDFSYIGSNFSFIYDIEKDEWTPLGFSYADGRYTAVVESLEHTEEAAFSPNGQYVVCDGYFVLNPQQLGGTEYFSPFRYEIATGSYTVYDGEEAISARAGAVDNAGNVYISSPYDSPYRDWYVRSGKYWVSCNQLLSQIYGTNVDRLTNYNDDCNSGTLLGIDETGTTLLSMISFESKQFYVVRFPKSPAALGEGINLLDSYAVTPAEGSTITSMRDFSVRFEREVEVVGEPSDIAILKSDGSVFKNAIKCSVSPSNGRVVEISIRKSPLSNGETYKLSIPAGMFCIKGDRNCPSGKIEISYNGRDNSPVKVLDVNPKSGSTISRFNMTGDPVTLLFDVNIAVSTEAFGSFNLVLEDGTLEPLSPLNIMVSRNQAMIYPQNDQMLYKDNNYRIVIGAGSITDVQGDCGNEEIVLDYVGAYERPVQTSGKYLFQDNFDDGNWLGRFMFFEGDHNTPNAEMQEWGFLNGDEYPWWIVRDDNDSEDWSLASHSMYSPAGKSNDWIVIPQLFIPDENCYLSFLSQSYRKNKEDRLKVYILESGVIHNYMTEQFVSEILENAELAYDEIQNPGAKEEILAGEWKENVIDLSKYAGKNIYIAFVNDNENQSVVFMDNVEVVHSVDLMLSLDYANSVVAKSSIPVKGNIKVDSATEIFNDLSIVLTDANGKEIDRIEATGLGLGHGDVYEFAFAKEFPLEKGRSNAFIVKVSSGEVSLAARGVVDNLMFQPTRRVVLEEGTGQACSNCPMGHEMIERLKKAYGDRFIPAALHTYSGDNLASGMGGYSSFLGITGYPSAVVNRRNDGQNFEIVFPMRSTENGFIYTSTDQPLWWDVVNQEMQSGTMLNVEFRNYNSQVTTPVYSADEGMFYIPVAVQYAMDAENLNHNILCVILEDDLAGIQVNGLCGSSDPLLGEWGQGGEFGKAVIDMKFDHVVRGFIGNSYNGVSGRLESNVSAGRYYFDSFNVGVPTTVANPENCGVIVMIIDSRSGKVLNANYSHFTKSSGVEDLNGDVAGSARVYAEGGNIVVEAAGSVDARAYSLAGAEIAAAAGSGKIVLDGAGYQGVVIVATTTEGTTTLSKVMLK